MSVNFTDIISVVPSQFSFLSNAPVGGTAKIAVLFKSSIGAAIKLWEDAGAYPATGSKEAWDNLFSAMRSGVFTIPAGFKSTQSTVNYVVESMTNSANILGKALGLSGSRISSIWADHGKKYLEGSAPATPSPSLLSEAKAVLSRVNQESTANYGTATVQDVPEPKFTETISPYADVEGLGKNLVVTSRKHSVAEFYLASLEAAYKVMSTYGARQVDTNLTNSLKAGSWQTIGDEANKAALLAAALGSTPDKVQEGWEKQRDVWKKGSKPTVPSPYFKGIGVYNSSGSASAKQVKQAVMAEPPQYAGTNDALSLMDWLKKAMPWLMIGAMGIGVMFFINEASKDQKRAASPVLANPRRRYQQPRHRVLPRPRY